MEEEFTITTLTAAINEKPYVPGQVGALNIFEEDGVATNHIKVEKKGTGLHIVEPSARGSTGEAREEADNRRMVTFEIDHFEIPDSVNADEIQGVRLFGSDDQLEVLDNRISAKQDGHAMDLDATLEHQRIGAIKGIVLSGKGVVLHNLYNQFEIAVPAPISLGLNAQVAGISTKIKGDVVYATEDDIDAPYDHIHALCGRDFHDQLWNQQEIRETFLADNQGYRLRDGAPDVFRAGQVTFERYRTGKSAKVANGGSAFIADNEARVFPVGVRGLFITRFGPPDWNGLTNSIGLPRYSRLKEKFNDKGYHLDSQMNAISLCTRPAALKTLTI